MSIVSEVTLDTRARPENLKNTIENRIDIESMEMIQNFKNPLT